MTLPTMTGTNVFGSSYDDPNGYAGTLYAIPEGTTKLPDLNALTPIGRLYASTLNVRPRPMSGGFPGIAPYRNEYFAIRWEAPLVVNNEGDYTFRVASEKGSVVRIDDMVIVDNDGNHPYAERSGPVHLIKTTHVITIDYFQTTGNVALQLFCKRHGEAEMICPTRL
ncbi:MAG: PA14 domain-containing protein [Polyangiaceae bacterium]|nr:PA14 domain-containing protein [Polyangiaceae bacterium]